MDSRATSTSRNDGEEIVISGIGGRFPNSENMDHLRENLFNRVDLVRADHGRWKVGK